MTEERTASRSAAQIAGVACPIALLAVAWSIDKWFAVSIIVAAIVFGSAASYSKGRQRIERLVCARPRDERDEVDRDLRRVTFGSFVIGLFCAAAAYVMFTR